MFMPQATRAYQAAGMVMPGRGDGGRGREYGTGELTAFADRFGSC
jgi:hypothetical protein